MQDAPTSPDTYLALRPSRSEFHPIRGLRYHVRVWDPDPLRPSEGCVLMLHGWMDVSASFQFLVDALAGNRRVIAPDWRGFGLTERPRADCYWFPDYLADLDFLFDALGLAAPVDVVAHSMGGNAAMLFAGVRPARIRRLVNLEGLGMPATRAEQAPDRYAQWLDELKSGSRMRDYANREEVARRLMANDSRLRPDQARFLAAHWSLPTPGGRFELAGDPAHKVVNPQLYRVDEVLACWRRITAPVLLVFADADDRWKRFRDDPDYGDRARAVRDLRVATVPDSGHMLHHDQPREVARLIEEFLA